MRPLLLLALTASLASPARAATLGGLEQDVARRAAERDAARNERRRLEAEARPLAEAVARSDARGPAASRELTRSLRALDRVAARLDEVEERIRQAERRLQGALVAFATQAELEEGALLERGRREGAASIAPALVAIGAARRRVAASAEPLRFRRPLEVSLAALDGPAEISAKLQVIDDERTRLAERERELVQEQSLLAARLRARREWARDLGAARRDAAGEIELLERAHESAEDVLRELVSRADAVSVELARVQQWDAELAARRGEAEERLRSLGTRGTP